MAKTSSQIAAERKLVSDYRNAVHKKQMAEVGAKNAARTYAVLAKGADSTKDPVRKAELSRAAQSVVDEYVKLTSTPKKESAKTAQDMQKKKEDRSEEKKRIASLYTQKANAEKVLREFDETSEIDWTDAAARKQHETERSRLQGEVERAGAEIDARKNQKIHDKNMAAIEAMSAEDRATLEKYVRERDERDDPLTVSNPLRFLMQDKKVSAAYAPLVEKYGEERLAKLAETYGRALHEQDARNIVEDTAAAVDTVPGAIGHNLLSVPASGIGGVLGTLGRANELFTRTGQYSTLEAYTPGDALNLYASTVRGATAENIEGEDGNAGRKVLSVGYQGIMTLADSISRSLALGPAGGAALAATSSFSQTMSEATKQGASPQQAVALGVATAGMEYLSEKIPMDEVFKLAKGGKTNVLMQAFKQAGVEITTEELSLFGSMAAEAAILQEKSSYKQQIGDLVAGGMSYEDAKAQADKAVWEEVKQTAYVSGFSGFLSGGGGAIVGNLTANNAPGVTEGVQQETTVQTPPEAPVVDEGQQTGPSAEQLLDGVQDMTPAPEPLSEGLQHFDNAAAIANGVQPAQQPAVDTAPAAEYDNSNISPALGASVGNSGVTYTSDNQAVPFQYAVVPAESLITSNDQFGNVNSAYPAELQPRDRTRTASQIQISKMAQNLNPALLAESATAENGAPIIRGDGVVVGGNARVNAIGMAYGSGNGGAYQQFITEKAAELGIDPATLPANPVLVRITNGVDNYTGLATALNETGVKTNSPSETAKIDASKMGDIIQYLSVGEDGNLNTAENREFIQQFTTHVVPSGEQDTVMQGNSQVSQAGVRRMQYALFHYAYNDTALLERLAESADNNAKNITNAMVATAGKVAQLQTEIGRGEVQDLGLQHAITDAVNLYLDAKAGKQTVEDAAGQLSMGENGPEAQHDGLTVHLAKFMESNNRSGKQIRDFIDTLIDVNMNATADTATEISMFDTGEQQTQEGLYDEAVTAYDQQRDGKGRIPEKSDFSQYRQYQHGELAAGMVGGRTEGDPGTAAPDGRIPQTVPADTPGGQRNLTEQNPGTVGAMQSQFKHEVKQSKVYGNTYQNTPYADVHDIGRAAKNADPNIDQYDVITEAESVHEAELRTQSGRDRLAEHRALMKKDGWTGADNDTAFRLLTIYRKEGKKDRFTELSRKQRQMATQAGQMAQSFAKYSREDATVAVQDAIADLDELTIDQVDRTFWKPQQEAKGAQGRKDAFQKWKESITGSLLEVANDIENVEDDDKAAMKDLVRQIANLRHTTAWAGYSSDLSRRTERGLDKMDFDTLKTVAKTQLSMIPNDFRKRDTGEILKQIRVQNMLFTLTTKFKNDAGNITNGIMDAVSDSFGGRMIDAVLGKMTGQRTVGNDLKFAKEYGKAARDAADVAAAFVSLDIPMETDAKYSSGRTRTWTPNTTNVFGRLMSAYEKHMKYALEVSDKFYEGGAAHVVNKSLQSLGEKSGLTAEQIQDIAQKTGERRTFKDPGASVDKSGQPKNGRMLARANVGLQKALNNIGTENIGLGDMVMPFAAVSGEVKQVGMDYTGGGLISGMKEIISIAKDVRNGKEIDPYRQRTAATNFGRGMTGVGLIAAFTAFAAAGAVKVHNDRDSEERMMNQTQGLSGAQWNLNSSIRWWEATMNGATAEEAAKAAEWQSGDELITIDFLEPYNTQMHIGYLLSQGEDIPTAIMQGNFNSLLEMPMMQTLSDLADLQQAFTEVSDGDMDGVYDAAGQLVGTVAGSVIPNWMRKTAQVIDPYYRDTYDTNPFRKAGKEILAAVPGLSAVLPKKYDNLGKEQRRYDSGAWMTAAFDNLVTPWDAETYQTNPVYQEIERLNAIDGIDVTPPQAKRKFTYTDRSGTEHENYSLSAEQYETLQRVQGQTAMELIENTMLSSDYAHMTDAQKDALFQNIYSYAEEHGRRAAISGYHSEAAAWMDKISGDPVNGLIRRATLSVIDSAVDKAMESIKNHWEMNPETKSNLDTLYDSFDDLSEDARKKILDDAVSDTARFLEVRSRGVRTEQYLDAVDYIADFPGTGSIDPDTGKPRQRDIDVREAIGKISGESNEVKDILMKAYMDDGDSTEMKYDYVRKVIGLSPLEYARAYRVQLDGGKKEQKMAKWKAQGLSDQEADLLYRLFAATGKTKIDVEAWAKKQ